MSSDLPPAESPVSYEIPVSRLPQSGTPVWLEADERQRAALARDHGLLDVPAFRLDLTLTPWKRGGIKVEGKVTADIVQQCVVSLDPLPAHLEVAVDALFVPESSRIAMPAHLAGSELLLDAEGDDGPETFSGDRIDVGALAEQLFALELDPYPRKPGAAAPRPAADEPEERGPLYEKLKGLAAKH